MRNIRLLIGIVAFGLGLAANAQRDSLFIVNFRLTAHMQAPATTRGHNVIYKTTATTVKVTTKDLLHLIAENHGYPAGYYDGDLLVESGLSRDFYIFSGDPYAGGTLLLYVLPIVLKVDVPRSRVYNGVVNTLAGTTDMRARCIAHITFDDSSGASAGNSFEFYGTEQSTSHEEGSAGFSTTFKAHGMAQGTLGHTPFYATGVETGAAKYP